MPRKNGRQRQQELKLRRSTVTFDSPSNRELILEAMQDAGEVPKKYRNWEHLRRDYSKQLTKGLNSRAARAAMGIKTDMNIFNDRTLRQMIPSLLKSYIVERYGEETYKRYKEHYNRSFNVEARRAAKDLERRTGRPWHRGHPVSSKQGGPDFNVPPQPARDNMALGEADRHPRGVMEDMGYPTNQPEGFYEWKLAEDGLGPRSGSVTTAGAARYLPTLARDGGISHEQLEWTQSRLQQLEAQGVDAGTPTREASPSMSTSDATAQSGASTLTVDDASTLQQNGNGSDTKHADYTQDEWRKYAKEKYGSGAALETYSDATGVLRTRAVSRAKPLIRSARRLVTPAVGGLGTAMDVIDTTTRINEAKEDPTLMNKAQAGISLVTSMVNGVATTFPATAPITEKLGLVGEAVLMGTDIIEDPKTAVDVMKAVPKPTSALMQGF